MVCPPVSGIKVIWVPYRKHCKTAMWKTEGYWRITFGETCFKTGVERKWLKIVSTE